MTIELPRRRFLSLLGLSAAAVGVELVAPEPVRRFWQVGRNAPVGHFRDREGEARWQRVLDELVSMRPSPTARWVSVDGSGGAWCEPVREQREQEPFETILGYSEPVSLVGEHGHTLRLDHLRAFTSAAPLNGWPTEAVRLFSFDES
jgi:hypothetical protein